MSAVPALHVGDAQAVVGPLTLFPIWTDAPVDRYRSYVLPRPDEEGLVREMPDDPDVSTVVVANHHGRPMLLPEGSTLVGGLQHRATTGYYLVAARGQQAVDVRCVERSRWSGERDQRFGRHESPLLVRAALRNLHAPDDTHADQGRVWANVDAYEAHVGRRSATHSLTSLVADVAAGLHEQFAGIRPLYGQRGLIVAMLGHPILAEITDHPRSLAQRWDGILSGLALDSFGVPHVPTPSRRARAFAALIRAAEVRTEPQPNTGASRVFGQDADTVSLRGMAAQDRLLHAVVMNRRHEWVAA